MSTTRLELDLTQQESIPPAGVAAALALMASGKLHRYGETGGKPSEASALEAEFARELGVKATQYLTPSSRANSASRADASLGLPPVSP